MPFLELFDETLDINSTETYELSVQISYDGLSFCLFDTIRNKFILIRAHEPEKNKYFNITEIDDLMTRDDFLAQHYKKVHVIVPTEKLTLIPVPLFDPARKETYFTFNHIREDHNMIIANRVNDPETFLVFSLAGQINDLIKKYYPGVHPFHHVKPLLCHISHKRKSVHGHYLHIHVEREFFNLIIFDHSSLKFCNTFKYRNITDILYFVLNVLKKSGIDQEETIYFSGLTEKYDDLSSNFSIYIRNIRFAEPSGNFSFSYVFNETELHRHLNLFSAINCE